MASLLQNATIKVRRDTAGNFTSNNPTLNQGEWGYETDTGKVKIGDGSTAWTSLAYITDANEQFTPVNYDLTSGDVIHALPTAVGFIKEIIIEWHSGVVGANELSFTTISSQTINGELASVWLGQGEGIIVLYSDGSNWRVKEYEDAIAVSDWEDVVKGRDGKYISGMVTFYEDNLTEASIYATLNLIMKTTGDKCLAAGTWFGSIEQWTSEIFRNSSTTFLLRTFNNTTNARDNVTIDADGSSGTWANTNKSAFSIVATNVSWK